MIDALIFGGLLLVGIVIAGVTAGKIIDRSNQNKDFSKNLNWINKVKAEGRMDDPNEMYGISGGGHRGDDDIIMSPIYSCIEGNIYHIDDHS